MATQQAEPGQISDITVCPICFQKFKTPRFLPCKHSFCHDCLCSYIVSQCKSTESRLGFRCPLCRQYIPSDGDIDKPEEWAGHFPLNDILQRIVTQPGERHCEPCLRDNEENIATNFCLSCKENLCELCTKYHAKFLALNDHKLLKFTETETNQILPFCEIDNHCPNHQEEQVQLYCVDHEKPCCAMCGATTHKKCEKVDEIKVAGQNLKESGKINKLLIETKSFKERLVCAKLEQESNITEIENTVDEKKAKFEDRFTCIVQHLEELKNKYFDEISSTLKKCRENLQNEIERVEEGILGIDYCRHIFEDAMDAACDETERVMKYVRAKETFHKLKKCKLKETNVQIETVEMTSWAELGALERIACVNLVKHSFLIEYDARDIKLSALKEFTIENANIKSGLFLSDGKFLFVNETEEQCVIYDEQWSHCHTISVLCKPFGVTQQEEEIFVTSPKTKKIEVFSSRCFKHLRSIPVPYEVYGITSGNTDLKVTCLRKILKISNNKIVREFFADCNCHYHIIHTKSGLMIYTNSNENVVVAMTDEGDTEWEYESPNLKWPRGLDVDSCDQIFVAGTRSDNVHVLSNTGEFIRLIENIPRPLFFKLYETTRTACVCSDVNKIIVYKF